FVTITAIDVSFGHALPLKGGKHITTTNYLIHDHYIQYVIFQLNLTGFRGIYLFGNLIQYIEKYIF
ncbi:hypothetical protein, partial [Xenorhabdus hominickii]|uniref:hypothetical protein n=1 Tax=Xenorhabdus hominickii TaxID=351679 RepID=UPI001B802916